MSRLLCAKCLSETEPFCAHQDFVVLKREATDKWFCFFSQIPKRHPTFWIFHSGAVPVIQKLKTHLRFLQNRIYRSPHWTVSYHHLMISFLFSEVKSQKKWNPAMCSAFLSLLIEHKIKQCQKHPPDSDLIPVTYTFHLSSLYPWLGRHILPHPIPPYHVIMGHLYAATLRLLAAIFGLFLPLSKFASSSQITTSLRTTLCWRQPWNTKGSSWLTSEPFRWNILVRMKVVCLLLPESDKLMQQFSFEIFFACLLSDLPLQISYPPDFSDSRHYGLLLLVYVSEMFTTRSICVSCDRKW